MPDTVVDAVMGWELCDTVSDKYYHLSDDFVFKQVEAMDRFKIGFQRSTIAADKGLFCVLWSSIGLEEHALFICNPVTKKSKELPFNGFFDMVVGVHNPVVLMSVEDSMASYKIYLIEEVHPTEPTRERMHVFDSKANLWLKLCDPPNYLNPSSGVIMNDMLYTLFWDSSTSMHSLWSYDATKDVWHDAGPLMPRSKIPQLVVCLGRLFLVRVRAASFTILEIHLAGKKLTSVASMPGGLFHHLVSLVPYADVLSPYHDRIGRSASFLAVASGASIVISTFRGGSVTYNLFRNSWHQSRVTKQLAQIFDPLDEGTGLYGNSVSLSLSMPPS